MSILQVFLNKKGFISQKKPKLLENQMQPK